MLIHPCWLHNHKWDQKWLLTCMIPWAGTFWDNACKQLHYTVFVHVARNCSLFFNLVEEVLEVSCLNISEFWSLQPVQQLAISFSFSFSSLYWSQFPLSINIFCFNVQFFTCSWSSPTLFLFKSSQRSFISAHCTLNCIADGFRGCHSWAKRGL